MRNLLFLLLPVSVFAQQNPELIRLNQIGFYPNSPKQAAVLRKDPGSFSITRQGESTVLFTGTLSGPRTATYNPAITRVADFSRFREEGTFVLRIKGTGISYPFRISRTPFTDVLKGAIKSYYYQRFSLPLEPAYAGSWSRPASARQEIQIHPSAATSKRPAYSRIDAEGGWFDAGDYNKYIVNSGITLFTLLSALESYTPVFRNLSLNIPESRNQIPDLADELLWNLRWMLTMQDPDDGGVYHKCTNAAFDATVMPDQTTATRYVVQKSTAAALDFAAVMAQASWVFQDMQAQLPGLADSCRMAATKAWNWAKANPHIIYDQDQLNRDFDPDITTGTYGDGTISDEWIWAATAMTILQKDSSYLKGIPLFSEKTDEVPSWNQVGMLASYLMVSHPGPFFSSTNSVRAKTRIINRANQLLTDAANHPYQAIIGGKASDFIWGSNAVAANQGILLLHAYSLKKDMRYRNGAISNLDYLLGRNATGFSFVTGFGAKTPLHIHHRVSESDGIPAPVPGLLAGGPNAGKQDKCVYSSNYPDECYTDDACSYASNEVAINWNAPLIYLIAAIRKEFEQH